MRRRKFIGTSLMALGGTTHFAKSNTPSNTFTTQNQKFKDLIIGHNYRQYNHGCLLMKF